MRATELEDARRFIIHYVSHVWNIYGISVEFYRRLQLEILISIISTDELYT